MFLQIAMGLNHIHSKRVLHRDLKTQNIFVAKGGILKLGDFGISKVVPRSACPPPAALNHLSSPSFPGAAEALLLCLAGPGEDGRICHDGHGDAILHGAGLLNN